MTVTETLQRCRIVLAGHYGQQFKVLVLYGSNVRRQAQPTSDSDIDVLVLLGEPYDYFRELRQVIELLYPIQLETDRLLSAKPAAIDDYERGRIQLYRNAKRQGVML